MWLKLRRGWELQWRSGCSVWVDGPEGRGFTRGKPESSEFNFKIRGDDPTFRESLRRRA